MEQIIYTINSKNYVLIEVPIKDEKGQKSLHDGINKYKAIYQGIKEIRRGFLFNGYAIVKVLVPEEVVFEFTTTID